MISKVQILPGRGPSTLTIKLIAAVPCFIVSLKAFYAAMLIGNFAIWGGLFGAFKNNSDALNSTVFAFVGLATIWGGAAAAGVLLARRNSLFLLPLAIILTLFVPPDATQILTWITDHV